MPYKILEKTRLSSVIWKMVVHAPAVAQSARPGQFVMVRLGETGERIPLTINDHDKIRESVTVVFQEAGTTTKKLGLLKSGDELSTFLGPLGHPTGFGRVGKVVLVAGGVGIAEILPIARYAKAEGNHVTTILGTRTRELLILEEELKVSSDKLIVMTDDGSYGEKGLVTESLRKIISAEKIDLCYVVGPDVMMKMVSFVTKEYNVKTLVSLDANMVDATGMCATCRVSVGGQTKFVCVDGPEFDAHLVDWDGFMKRQKRFVEEEKRSLAEFEAKHKNCMYKAE